MASSAFFRGEGRYKFLISEKSLEIIQPKMAMSFGIKKKIKLIECGTGLIVTSGSVFYITGDSLFLPEPVL